MIIGNPPYIRMEIFKELKSYLKQNYQVHGPRSDLYVYFIERGHKLLHINGLFGMIVSNKFIKANYGVPIRDFLHKNTNILEIIDFAGLPVFQGATIRTIILLTQYVNHIQNLNILYLPPVNSEKFRKLSDGSVSVEQLVSEKCINLPNGSVNAERWLLIDEAQQRIIEKLQKTGEPLIDVVGNILYGIKTGLNEAFVIDGNTRKRIIETNPMALEIIKPFLFGEEVRRYLIEPKDRYLIYTYHGIDMSRYPEIENYLRKYKPRLEQRATKQEWYELQQPSIALVPLFENPKIVYALIARSCQFAYDRNNYYSNDKTFIIPTSDLYILGLLNSAIALFYFSTFCAALEGSNDCYFEFRAQYVKKFPIPKLDTNNRLDLTRHERMVSLVEQMLSLHKQLQEARTPHEQTALQRQIEATDEQINALVYKLYGLTNEEIKVVEKAIE